MYLITFRTIAELSTPFVNLRWYHYQLGNKDNFWYKFASLSMMALFFLSRIATLPYNWYALIVTLMDPQCAVIVKIYYRVWIVSGYLVLDFLNLYWFSKMLKGARKFFLKRRTVNHHRLLLYIPIFICMTIALCAPAIIDIVIPQKLLGVASHYL